MKPLHSLEKENFIAIAKLIDNNFIGNPKIIVDTVETGVVRVIGHTEGGQCISCDVKIDVSGNKLNAIFIQNEDPEINGAYRHVYPPTIKRVIDYLKENDFDFCPKTTLQ